jgi:hypothetical protein
MKYLVQAKKQLEQLRDENKHDVAACLKLLARKTKSLQSAEIAELQSPRLPSPNQRRYQKKYCKIVLFNICFGSDKEVHPELELKE